MKGQPNWDSNPVPTSPETNHATNWANEAGLFFLIMLIILEIYISTRLNIKIRWVFHCFTLQAVDALEANEAQTQCDYRKNETVVQHAPNSARNETSYSWLAADVVT